MLNLSGIVSDSIVDGPGIRTCIFSQGCPHHCEGCHNPETWDFGCGTPMAEETIAQIVRSNPLCRGVTFSGGEPFAQSEGFAKLARLLKERGYEVASYSGYTFEELLEGSEDQKQLLQSIDILIDGPFRMEERSLELNFRGSRNQRILNVPESLKAGAAVLEQSLRWRGEYTF
jgi:anaerobic ribonucleoside-triphosphate reductase activating protein